MKPKLPSKTFNLFNSYNAELPFVDRLYKWMTSVGKYIVIGVEMVVLTAFIARFFLDQNLNDLTEKINTNNSILNRLKPDEANYRSILDKTISGLGIISTSQKNITDASNKSLLDEIPHIYSITPTNVLIKSISYKAGNYPLTSESVIIIASMQSDQAKTYENNLLQNILNVSQDITKPNISLKELNISSTDTALTDYTLKISTNL